MSDRDLIAELARNLACRGRLGLKLVTGGPGAMARLAGSPAPSAAPASGAASPATDLAQVRAQLGECTRCGLAKGRNHIVFGQGPEDAALLIVGEGPGAAEDAKGLPFVGPAGRLLDLMLASVGLKRSQVYITNIVKCRPPNNRDPQPEEIAACLPFLKAQATAIAPAAVLTLGKPAAQTLLQSQAPISALRGEWKQFAGLPLLPTFHPAFLLRNPLAKGQAYQDLKKLAKALKASRAA